MAILFKASKQLEAQIDEYLDCVSEGSLVFRTGVVSYLQARQDEFNDKLSQITDLEKKADELRREIENRLYTHTLIPEHRGDVLGLLENIDDVLDNMKETLFQFDVEIPFIPGELHKDYESLTDVSCQSVESLVFGTRAFFRDVKAVKDHLHKVYYFEKEADRIGDHLKRRAFRMDMDLSQKFHLRYFALHIQQISDRAENVADRLAIYTIKRTI